MSRHVRGIYSCDDNDEDAEWQAELVRWQCETGVPKFRNSIDLERFESSVMEFLSGSNPEYSQFRHIFTVLADKNQVMEFLVRKLEQIESAASLVTPLRTHEVLHQNRFNDNKSVALDVEKRLKVPFHTEIYRQGTLNTLDRMFQLSRSGIFVMIRNGQVVMFVPFCNKDHRNDWSKYLSLDPLTGEFYARAKSKAFGQTFFPIEQLDSLWSDGSTVMGHHYRIPSEQLMEDKYFLQIRDMLETCCLMRKVSDCEFFINLQAYPLLKVDLSDPNTHLFQCPPAEGEEEKLEEKKKSVYTPILSLRTSKRFADIGLPSSEDWESACQYLFPRPRVIFSVEPPEILPRKPLKQIPWSEKVPTAFWRGPSTGRGTTADSNQRLKLAVLSQEWGDFGTVQNVPRVSLNAKIVGIDSSDKQIPGAGISYQNVNELTVEKDNIKGHLQSHAQYKYLLYVDGNGSAPIYGCLMAQGSVILKVSSDTDASDQWFFPLLQPYIDHIPIKSDLSDLGEKLEWCLANDERCRLIAENCLQLHNDILSKEAILDYLELVINKIGSRWRSPPKWSALSPTIPPPVSDPPRSKCFVDRRKRMESMCSRCEQSMKTKGVIGAEISADSKSTRSCRKCRRINCKCEKLRGEG